MKLTIEKIKEYWISKNTSRANNINDTYLGGQLYNDSINIYEAVNTILADNGPVAFTLSQNSNLVSLTVGDITNSITGATTVISGVMTAGDKLSLENLITLSGVSAANLGTFTGTIISDNTTIKNALQQLETAVQNVSASALSYDYSNVGTTYTLTSTMTYLVTQGGNLQVTVGASMANLVPHYIFVRQVSNNSFTFVASSPYSIWADGSYVTETIGTYGLTGATNYHSVFMAIRNNNIIFITKIQ